MLSLLLWWSGIVLEGLLLFRGFRSKLLTKYSAFYSYVLVMFLSDGLLYLLNLVNPKAYEKWSWYTGFLILFVGGGVLLEIFKQVLSSYAGAEKIARIVGTSAFGIILCFAIIYPILVPNAAAAHATYHRVQRDYLFVQSVLLLGLLQVIGYYGIEMGRNLKGMVLGYGQCIATTLITLALRAYIGVRFDTAWILLQQFSYLVALAIWVVALWSYHANFVPQSDLPAGGDYDRLATRTRDLIGAAGAQLVKVERL